MRNDPRLRKPKVKVARISVADVLVPFMAFCLSALIVLFAFSQVRAAEKKNQVGSVIEDLKFVPGQGEKNDIRAAKTEQLITHTEELAISQVKKLLKKHRGTYLEPELWFRLAELYMRRAKSAMFFEVNRESDKIVSLMPKALKKKSSKDLVQKAISIYAKLQSRFPRFANMDMVIFNQALASQQISWNKKAEALYWKLITKFKASALVPDAHLAIGEINFKRQNFKFALEHFEAIKKYPNSRVYPYGVYKAAWSQYNLQNAIGGLKELEEVVRYGVFVSENNIDARLDLRKEALADMAVFFEEVLPASAGHDYFVKQAGSLDPEPYVLKLATLYSRHSKYGDEKVLLEDFKDKRKSSAELPEVFERLVSNGEAQKDRPEAVDQLKQFHALCAVDSRWTKAQQKAAPVKVTGKQIVSADEESRTCQERLNKTALRYAQKWLRLWKKNPTYTVFADSLEQAFQIYLERNLESEEATKARFVYAEHLFSRKRYRQASEQYEIVSNYTKDKTISHDSHYAAVLALEKSVPGKWEEKDEKRFRALVGKYKKSHPKGKYLLDVEFKMALIAYEKENYAFSAPIFKDLGARFAKQDKGEKSQDLYMDILNIQKNFTELKVYAQALGKVKGADPKRLAKLKQVYRQSYFLEIQDQQEKGRLAEAVEGYQKFALENRDSKLAPQAYWNSVEIQFKIGRAIEGAESAVKYTKLFSKGEQVQAALERATEVFELAGLLDKASETVVKLADRKPKEKSLLMTLAADYADLSGSKVKAKSMYQDILKSGAAKDKAYAAWKLYSGEYASNATEKESFLKSAIATKVQPYASLAQLVVVERVFESKNLPEAFKEASTLVSMGKEADTHARAKARFIQARILEEEFRKQSVKSQLDRVSMVLALKTEKLEKAQQAFQAVTRYGDAELAVEALRRLAGCYKHYAEALKTMPIPDGLEAQDAQVFRQELDRLTFPMEDKSVETLAEALEQAKSLKLYTGQAQQIQAEINRLNFQPVDPPIELGFPTDVLFPQVKRVEVGGL